VNKEFNDNSTDLDNGWLVYVVDSSLSVLVVYDDCEIGIGSALIVVDGLYVLDLDEDDVSVLRYCIYASDID